MGSNSQTGQTSGGGAGGGIRAGKAFVELGVKDNTFYKGLANAATAFRNFGSSLARASKSALGGGVALGLPIAQQLRGLMSEGAELQVTSTRLGTTAEELQAVSLAAARAGVDFDAFAEAAGKLQVKIGQAMSGNDEAIDSFARLGLSAQALANLGLEDRFAAIADALSRLPTDFQRSAAAVKLFEEAGAKLVPALQNGEAFRATTQRARELGMVLSNDTVASAAKANAQFNLLRMLGARAFQQLGAAMLPVVEAMEPFVIRTMHAARAFGEFAKENRAAIQIVGLTAVGLIAASVALKGFSIAMHTAAGAVTASLTGLKLLVAGISLLPAVCNPVGLAIGGVVAALAAATAAWVSWTREGQRTGEALKGIWQGTGTEFSNAWEAIKSQLASGDLEGAVGTVVDVIRLQWQKLVGSMSSMWESFKATLRIVKEDIFSGIQSGWAETVNGLKSIWLDFKAEVWDPKNADKYYQQQAENFNKLAEEQKQIEQERQRKVDAIRERNLAEVKKIEEEIAERRKAFEDRMQEARNKVAKKNENQLRNNGLPSIMANPYGYTRGSFTGRSAEQAFGYGDRMQSTLEDIKAVDEAQLGVLSKIETKIAPPVFT